MKERQEVLGEAVPPDHEAAIVVEPREEALDLPAARVAAQRPAVLCDAALRPVRRNHLDPHGVAQMDIEAVAIVGLVADQSIGPVREEAVLARRVDEPDFGRRSRGHVDGERKTMAVADRHDLAALISLSRSDGGAPFFAGLKVPSMKPSVRSSWPRSRRSSARRSRASRSHPVRRHC